MACRHAKRHGGSAKEIKLAGDKAQLARIDARIERAEIAHDEKQVCFVGKRNGSRTCLVQIFGRAGTNLGRDASTRASSKPKSPAIRSRYLRLIDFVYHSTLSLRVIKKKKKKKKKKKQVPPNPRLSV